jgi:hypothetical protein
MINVLEVGFYYLLSLIEPTTASWWYRENISRW